MRTTADARPAGARWALVVRGGWEGHVPVAATEVFIPFLEANGFDVEANGSLEDYTDAAKLAATDLVVQCWTMGEATGEQVKGLADAVAAGTGLAGWHGGIVDSFRASSSYLHLTGGQFAAHPGGFVDHSVEVVPAKAGHPIVAGFERVTLRTEQYWVLTDALDDVLATTTFAATGPGGTEGLTWAQDVTVPAVWARQWGAGKVFVRTVGHSVADLEVPEVRGIIERGLLWASR